MIATASGSGTQRAANGCYYRIADGTETSTYTWTGNAVAGTASALGKMLRITGMRPGSYLSAFVFDGDLSTTGGTRNSTTGTDATAEIAQQTIYMTNDLILISSAVAQSGAGLSVLTASPPAGYTEQSDFGQALSGTETSMTIDSKIQPTTGVISSGTRVITWSGTPTLGSWASLCISIQADLPSPYIVTSSANATGTADGTGVTISVPSGTADGNLLVAVVAMSAVVTNTTVAPVITAPAGWTLIGSAATPNSDGTTRASRLSVYQRTASSEPASYVWKGDKTSAQGATGKMYRIANFNTSSPINASSFRADAATTTLLTFTAITATVVNTLILDITSNASAAVATHSGMVRPVRDVDFGTDPGDASSLSVAIARAETTADIGSSGVTFFSVSASSFNCTARIAIAPPAMAATAAIFAGA